MKIMKKKFNPYFILQIIQIVLLYFFFEINILFNKITIFMGACQTTCCQTKEGELLTKEGNYANEVKLS